MLSLLSPAATVTPEDKHRIILILWSEGHGETWWLHSGYNKQYQRVCHKDTAKTWFNGSFFLQFFKLILYVCVYTGENMIVVTIWTSLLAYFIM